MKDDRDIRQVVIDRIIAYNNALEFYAPVDKKEYDFFSMDDKEIVHLFEMVVFNNHKVKEQYRKDNPDVRGPKQ